MIGSSGFSGGSKTAQHISYDKRTRLAFVGALQPSGPGPLHAVGPNSLYARVLVRSCLSNWLRNGAKMAKKSRSQSAMFSSVLHSHAWPSDLEIVVLYSNLAFEDGACDLVHPLRLARVNGVGHAKSFLNAFFSLSRFSFLRARTFSSSAVMAASSGTSSFARTRSFSAESSSLRTLKPSERR